MSMPSFDNKSSFSSYVKSPSASFKFSSLNAFPRELKNSSTLRPLCFTSLSSTSADGGVVTMSTASNSTPASSKNSFAFLHVVHFGYSYTVIILYLHIFLLIFLRSLDLVLVVHLKSRT